MGLRQVSERRPSLWRQRSVRLLRPEDGARGEVQEEEDGEGEGDEDHQDEVRGADCSSVIPYRQLCQQV